MPYVMGLDDVLRLNFGFPVVPGQGAFATRLTLAIPYLSGFCKSQSVGSRSPLAI
jgi:hypothetical protein